MAPGVLPCENFLPAEPFILQLLRRSHPDASQVTDTRIQGRQFTEGLFPPPHKKANTKTNPQGQSNKATREIIRSGLESYCENSRSLHIPAVSTPNNALAGRYEECEDAIAVKKRRLFWSPNCEDTSEAAGNAQISKNLPRDGAFDFGKHGGTQKNDLDNSNNLLSFVSPARTFQPKFKSVQAFKIYEADFGESRKAFLAQSEQTEYQDSSVERYASSLFNPCNFSNTGNDSQVRTAQLGVSANTVRVTKEDLAPADYDVDASSDARSGCYKNNAVPRECIQALAEADKPEISSNSELSKNCDPVGNESDHLPAQTTQGAAPPESADLLWLREVIGNKQDAPENCVLLNRINAETNPLIETQSKLHPSAEHKRKKCESSSPSEERAEKRSRTQFSEPLLVASQYTSLTQLTGGEITLRSRQDLGVEEETRLVDDGSIPAENQGYCDISADRRHEDHAFSCDQETSSVFLVNDDGRSAFTCDQLPEPVSATVDFSGRRASVDIGDASIISGKVSMPTTYETLDDRNSNGSLGVAPAVNIGVTIDTIPAAENLFRDTHKKLIEKLAHADAKLTEDVGNEAEKVITFRDSHEPDFSTDKLPYIVPTILKETRGPLQCSFCLLLFTSYRDLENHSIERHSKGWWFIKNSVLRALVPYRSEGFLLNHPRMKFKCIFCSKLFSCYSAFAGHLAERHYGDNPYECPFCSERFNTAYAYSIHLDAHVSLANYPSFKCNGCSLYFCAQWQLDLHSEVHDRLSSPIVID